MFTLPLLLALAPCVPASPAEVQVAPAPELNVYYENDPVGIKLTAQLLEPQGASFALVAWVPGGNPVILGYSPTGADFVTKIPAWLMAKVTFPIEFLAAYRQDGTWKLTESASMALGVKPQCDLLDFNFVPGPDDGQVAGALMTDQWADIGIHISADNSKAGHPDKAILFDSASPTGGDTDLKTPNPMGFGNDTPFGKVLIIAENDKDVSPADTIVDVPDDEAAGGSIYFDFEDQATVCSVTLIDIDESPGTQLRFYRDGDLVTPDETLNILSLGNGSVQKIDFYETKVDRFEVFFKGSGAIGRVELIPCPRVINFDETSTGIPKNLGVGEWITNQFANIGVTVSAMNNDGSHPDKAILFDSENPTGEDFDLLTPNPMVAGNDTPLGKVLILAEDDVDVLPPFGFVDDPDDEQDGGLLQFSFAFDVRILSATVLDVDGNELDLLRFYDKNDMEITSIVIPDLPNGNVQKIDADVSGVRKLVLDLGGSGAITRIRFCVEPKKKLWCSDPD